MIARGSDPWISAALLVISTAALGTAIHLGDGTLMPRTMLWLSVAFVACTAAVLVPWPGTRWRRIAFAAAVVAALGWEISLFLARGPFGIDEVQSTVEWLTIFRIGAIAASLAALATLIAGPRLRHVTFALLLAIHFMLGVSTLRAIPQPHIDVFVFQRDASQALLGGTNPYGITFPDIYPRGAPWYGPGMSREGRLQFGYPYMPLTLLLATPAHWMGDYRYANLAAVTLAAALIAYARPSPSSFAAAALLLLQPRGLYVLQRGWSEPMILLALASTVFCAARYPRVLPWLAGLLLVSKQYMPFLVGTATLLLREPLDWREGFRFFSRAAIAACIVTLPMVIWDFNAFWHSAAILQFKQPFRFDSLSYLALWADRSQGGLPPPLWVPFAALLVATALVLWRCEHSVAGFAGGVALVLFAFFAFNKQAFANYYYLVIGAMCCAIATVAGGGQGTGQQIRTQV